MLKIQCKSNTHKKTKALKKVLQIIQHSSQIHIAKVLVLQIQNANVLQIQQAQELQIQNAQVLQILDAKNHTICNDD